MSRRRPSSTNRPVSSLPSSGIRTPEPEFRTRPQALRQHIIGRIEDPGSSDLLYREGWHSFDARYQPTSSLDRAPKSRFAPRRGRLNPAQQVCRRLRVSRNPPPATNEFRRSDRPSYRRWAAAREVGDLNSLAICRQGSQYGPRIPHSSTSSSTTCQQ